MMIGGGVYCLGHRWYSWCEVGQSNSRPDGIKEKFFIRIREHQDGQTDRTRLDKTGQTDIIVFSTPGRPSNF